MSVNRVEAGRNNLWPRWYPTVRPDFSKIPVEGSPYGEPNTETLALFGQLPGGSKVGDIGGGDGRFALPLARMGHKVLMTDVDMPHLVRANEKEQLQGVTGTIMPILADATKKFPIEDQSLDAVLNAGFGYLIPPTELDHLFGKMTRTLRPDGLLVFEFATNRDRRDTGGKSLIGEQEYNYSHAEGTEVLKALATKHGIRDLSMQTKTIHFEEPYFMHNDLIIAHGFKAE